MIRLENDIYSSFEFSSHVDPVIRKKSTTTGPRGFMILPDCFRHITRSGTSSRGFTAIFAENRLENEILTKWYKVSTTRELGLTSEIVDATVNQYGENDNIYVVTSDIKAEGFEGMTKIFHPQCKFEHINQAPEDFEKLKDE